MMAVALILAACDGDSGNNGTEMEGGSSSSIEYGTLTYEGRTYKTVVIGTQTWMAENLNYADSVIMTNLAGNSWCYENSADSCAKYGRLYTWTAAMNIVGSYQSVLASAVISTPHQGVCPAGWHIPTNAEWTILEKTVGDSSAGTALKNTSGWDGDGNGTDAYGFSALPAGFRNNKGDFYGAGNYTDFWSVTEYDDGMEYAYYRGLSYSSANMFIRGSYKNYAYSVRCLKDTSTASVQESSSSTDLSSSSVSLSSSSASDLCDFSMDEDVWEFTKGSTKYSYVIDENDTLTVSINGKVKYTYDVSTASARQIRYDAAVSTCEM